MDGQLVKKTIVEFVGTFALCFMGIGAIVMTGGDNLVAIAFAHGLAIGLLIMAAGQSRADSSTRRSRSACWSPAGSAYNAGAYIIAQLLGAVAGDTVYPGRVSRDDARRRQPGRARGRRRLLDAVMP